MNLIVHGNHIEVTASLREYVQGKLAKVERHFDQVIDANVQLSVEKVQQKAEITLHLSGNHIHVESIEQDMYAAIDSLVDKLDRQVLRHKDRVKSHQGEALKRQPLPSTPQ